jgi:hypothetical protein
MSRAMSSLGANAARSWRDNTSGSTVNRKIAQFAPLVKQFQVTVLRTSARCSTKHTSSNKDDHANCEHTNELDPSWSSCLETDFTFLTQISASW